MRGYSRKKDGMRDPAGIARQGWTGYKKGVKHGDQRGKDDSGVCDP